MEAVDGFEFEVGVLILGDGRFKIDIDQGVDISEFSEELEDTLVTDFSDGDFDTSQVEDHLTEQSFFDDGDYFRLTGCVNDDFLEQRKSVQAYVFLTQ